MNRKNLYISLGVLAAVILAVILLVPMGSSAPASADNSKNCDAYGYKKNGKECNAPKRPLLYKMLNIE